MGGVILETQRRPDGCHVFTDKQRQCWEPCGLCWMKTSGNLTVGHFSSLSLISILFQCLVTLQSILSALNDEKIYCIYGFFVCFWPPNQKLSQGFSKKLFDSIFHNNIQRPHDFLNCSCFSVQGLKKYFVLKISIKFYF